MAKKIYGIVANCNFESRDDAAGKAIHAARKAVEASLTRDATLVVALDRLEDVLSEYADSSYTVAVNACRAAEADVVAAWTDEVQAEVEEAREARYAD